MKAGFIRYFLACSFHIFKHIRSLKTGNKKVNITQGRGGEVLEKCQKRVTCHKKHFLTTSLALFDFCIIKFLISYSASFCLIFWSAKNSICHKHKPMQKWTKKMFVYANILQSTIICNCMVIFLSNGPPSLIISCNVVDIGQWKVNY